MLTANTGTMSLVRSTALSAVAIIEVRVGRPLREKVLVHDNRVKRPRFGVVGPLLFVQVSRPECTADWAATAAVVVQRAGVTLSDDSLVA
jgi:hypothetical protein